MSEANECTQEVIPVWLDYLEKRILEHKEVCESLIEKIRPSLHPEEARPAQAAEQAVPAEIKSQLADRLEAFADELAEQTEKIRHITMRVEL